ncbi:uncharacterized protein LOC143470901 [Clavelina lepadiformis]|uniref:Uncharacterized protein n=1 Tax=Clavelina lepadiformis TaxID=159417 RepID=A0ABP0FLL5_CLALP
MTDRSEEEATELRERGNSPPLEVSETQTEIPFLREEIQEQTNEPLSVVQTKLNDAVLKYELYAEEAEKHIKNIEVYKMKFNKQQLEEFKTVVEQTSAQMAMLKKFDFTLNRFQDELDAREESGRDRMLVETHKRKVNELRDNLHIKQQSLEQLLDEVDAKFKFYLEGRKILKEARSQGFGSGGSSGSTS